MNLRRVPGVLYHYRLKVSLALGLVVVCTYGILQSGIICTNHNAELAVKELCRDHMRGVAMGTLCEPLCMDGTISTFSCVANHAGKYIVFSAKWDDQPIMIKSALSKENRLNATTTLPQMTEEAFQAVILDLVTNKLNVTISDQQLARLTRLDSRKQATEGTEERLREQINAYTLLQSQEYLLTLLFADRDVFPQLLGTCGHLYAVEYLREPQLESNFMVDEKKAWYERMQLAVSMMDLLEELETNFPDPLHLCDIKMSHFGQTVLGRLKYMDLDMVETENVLQRLTASGKPCREDPDCDLFDCKATCNPNTKRCDVGVASNNLQVVCEHIFIGWTLSGKMIVPGLLMSEQTPASLAALLRQCAENGRAPVPEDIRQRLYTTLSEMAQILSDNL